MMDGDEKKCDCADGTCSCNSAEGASCTCSSGTCAVHGGGDDAAASNDAPATDAPAE